MSLQPSVWQHMALGYECPNGGVMNGCPTVAQCQQCMREYVSNAWQATWWGPNVRGIWVPPACKRQVYFGYSVSPPEQKVLSNMKQTIITIHSIRYNSAEQAYQTHKALYTGCEDLRCRIMVATSLWECKWLGRQVDPMVSEQWHNNFQTGAVPIMIMILRAKYCQCCAFRRILKDPDSRPYFLEAMRCRFWGIGCHQVDTNQESCDQVKGQNWMGKILTMMALCMHPMTFQAVTQVALTGYEGTVNHVEEQQALAIIPELFLNPIRILGEDHSDKLNDKSNTN